MTPVSCLKLNIYLCNRVFYIFPVLSAGIFIYACIYGIHMHVATGLMTASSAVSTSYSRIFKAFFIRYSIYLDYFILGRVGGCGGNSLSYHFIISFYYTQ